MEKSKLGALLVFISALGFGTMAILAKIAYAQGANIYTVLAVRFTLASLIIWAIILLLRQPAAISPAGLKPLALLSLLGYGGGSTFFFLSVRLLPASLASMLLYTYPVIVALAEMFIYHQKLTRWKVLALLLSTAGLVFILGTTIDGVNATGVFYGFAAAVAYSAYLLYGNRIAGDRPPLVTTGYLLLFAAGGFSLYAFLSGTADFRFGPPAWWSIAGLAVFSTALAILALFAGMRWIEASRAAILSTFEPVFTVICAAIFLSEAVRPMQILGGLMILSAVVILQAG
ncbi:MAG: DMT family transporter, partial [Firmicutes bacterium]|nr:DMT family transporter [Bacillota bacterium]